jgi:transketolase
MPGGRLPKLLPGRLTFDGAGDFQPDDRPGRNLHYGIREHAASGVAQGAYVLAEAGGGRPQVILLATGSEVHLALEAREELEAEVAPRAPGRGPVRPGLIRSLPVRPS